MYALAAKVRCDCLKDDVVCEQLGEGVEVPQAPSLTVTLKTSTPCMAAHSFGGRSGPERDAISSPRERSRDARDGLLRRRFRAPHPA